MDEEKLVVDFKVSMSACALSLWFQS